MGYVVTKDHLLYPSGISIPSGTILEVGSSSKGWVVKSGVYKMHLIPIGSCESLPLYQELLQRREEIVELMREKEELFEENLRIKNRIKQLEINAHKSKEKIINELIGNLVKSVYAQE